MDAQRALTVLTRLSMRRPGQLALLQAGFCGRLEGLARPVLEVAIETGDPIGKALAREVESRDTVELLETLVQLFDEDRYDESVPLSEAALAATERLLELGRRSLPGAPTNSKLAELARLTLRCGYRLGELGRYQ
ncbi:MAG: hypothetical protein AAF368_19040, partial [Planctomycetota bacterium]